MHRTILGLREEVGVDLGNTSQMSLLPFRNALGTSLILPKTSLSLFLNLGSVFYFFNYSSLFLFI